jgi:hypothetical protein
VADSARTPNSSIAVNQAVNPGKKLATYEFFDDKGCPVESEAVTLTDGLGNELLGPQEPSRSIPVVVADQASILHLGKETAVGATAVRLLHANHRRVTGLVENTGGANIRVGPRGVTPTTGYRLQPNCTIIYELPRVYRGEIWAISEGTDSIAYSEEETAARPQHHHDKHDKDDKDDKHEHHEHHEGCGCAPHEITGDVDEASEGD